MRLGVCLATRSYSVQRLELMTLSAQQAQQRKRSNRAGQVRRELVRGSLIPSDLGQMNSLPVA